MTTDFDPYTARDKRDTTIHIRSYDVESISDARDMLTLGLAVTGEGTGMTALPEDLPKTVDAEQKYFREFTAPANNIVIVAEIDGRIVAAVNVRSPVRRKLLHNATLGISVLPEFQGRGIGRLLMDAVVTWARANPVITRLRLGVLSDNDRAKPLYESFGFVVEGRFTDRVRPDPDDPEQYADEILMWLNVES